VLTHGDAKSFDSDFYSKSDIVINNNQHHNHKNDNNHHDHDICCTHSHHSVSLNTENKIMFAVDIHNTYHSPQNNPLSYLLTYNTLKPPQYFLS
jgi:hypothetical protein